jgi:hypothetical protein
MQYRMATGIGLAALLMAFGGVSEGAQQFKSTRTFYAKNPGPTGDMLGRKILFKSKEGPGSTNTVTGDPTVNGAKLHLALGNSGSDQCFELPAGGWSSIANLGFKYNGFNQQAGAVTSVSIKKTPAGLFLVKIRLAGANGQLDVVPAAGTTDMNLNLSLGGGDEYCAGGATPPDAQNTDKIYKVKRLPAPLACGVAACP